MVEGRGEVEGRSIMREARKGKMREEGRGNAEKKERGRGREDVNQVSGPRMKE